MSIAGLIGKAGSALSGLISGSSSGLIGMASSALSGLISGASSSRAARRAFNYNKKLIEMQQNWQERMSNTAHQREVSDLRAAGLNPILSATGGSGASFGSASAPSMNVQPADFGDALSSAIALRQQINTNKLTKSQNELAQAQTRDTNSAQALKDEQRENEILQQYINHNTNESIIQKMYNDNAITDATVNEINSRTAKNIVETRYLPRLINSQIEGNSAGAYYNRHRALGYSYSDSYSSNDSYSNGSLGPTNWLPSKSGSSAYSHSRSYTK